MMTNCIEIMQNDGMGVRKKHIFWWFRLVSADRPNDRHDHKLAEQIFSSVD